MFAGRGDNPLAAVLEEVVQKQEGLVSPAPVCAGILEEIEQCLAWHLDRLVVGLSKKS